MPDTTTPMPLAKALRTHPKTSGVHPSTARRWSEKGARGKGGEIVRLEIEFIGSRLFLTHAAIDRFLAALNADEQPAEAPKCRSPKRRNRESERAGEELARMGVK